MGDFMQLMKKILLPVLLATIWISFSEFLRNEILFKMYWIEHYQKLGLIFPSEPLNGAVWGLWSLLMAVAVFIISKKFELWQTTLLVWLVSFVFMWVVIGNLGVLPFGLLPIAVPWSLAEVFLASVIIRKLTPH